MPKKLNTNPKAEEARQRKDGVKKEKKAGEAKAAEDARWADEGQSATERRAAEKAKKQLEELKKKETKKAALAKDEEELKAVKTVKVNPYKVTVATIQQAAAAKEREKQAEREEEERRRQRLLLQPEPTENVNQAEKQRLREEEALYGKDGVVSARTLDEAVSAMTLVTGGAGEDDRHPEKRMKAAFREYEEKQWEELKRENPTLRHSQLKDLLFKQWQVAHRLHTITTRNTHQLPSSAYSPHPSVLRLLRCPPVHCSSLSVPLRRRLPRTRSCKPPRGNERHPRPPRVRRTTDHRLLLAVA